MTMFAHSEESRRLAVYTRADFLLFALRQHLPESTVCHEKRSAWGQLESLCIVSPQGYYTFNTFDRRDPRFELGERFDFGDLAVSVRHVWGTNESLSESEVAVVLREANEAFERLSNANRQRAGQLAARITCTLNFRSSDENLEHEAQRWFQAIANRLDLPITYRPHDWKKDWLPVSGIGDLDEDRDNVYRAAECKFASPIEFQVLLSKVQRVAPAVSSLRPPGPMIRFADLPEVNGITLVGRSY